MVKIYINESQINLLTSDKKEEVTFYEFVLNVKQFLKDLLKKPMSAEPSSLFKNRGITKDELIKKMKDIGLLQSEERIDEVPCDESHESKLVAKHYITYKIPRSRFSDKIKALYNDIISENNKKNYNGEQISSSKVLYDNKSMNKKCVSYNDEELVSETDCGGAMQGGGSNPSAGQYDVPFGSVQRKDFFKSSLTRNKDEKNKSISINR